MPNDELDRLLDSALATYADPGPDAGLEGRVLASLTANRQPREQRGFFARTRAWLPWAIALPLAASLVLWIGTNRTPQPPLQGSDQAQQRSTTDSITTSHAEETKDHAPVAKAQQASTPPSTRLKPCRFKFDDRDACISARREVAQVAPLPKLDVFPTPRPLTTEEKVLVAVARGGSKAQREALAAEPAQSDAPLDISALTLPPLASSGEGKN